MITIRIDWQGKKGLDNLIRYIKNNMVYGEAQEKIRIIGHHAADNMQKAIKETGYNLDKLANSILAETISTTGGVEVGIGRIESLPFYWEMFNVGFKPGAAMKLLPIGGFTSGSGLSGDVTKPISGDYGLSWQTGMGHSTFFDNNMNKKPVEPIEYIEKSMRLLDMELTETMKKLGEKFIEGMGRESK